jgi:queuine tRNA-ribosyltransferase
MQKNPIHFEVTATAPGTNARTGVLSTRRGLVETPIFMPVGTQATVRGMTVEDLQSCNARILLANTYHLIIRPGLEVFKQFGGIHRFMQWDGPVLTDSGGFQIFSLPNHRRMTEEGAVFLSHVDGRRIHLSPESSIAAQTAINSDIMMVLDECVPSTSEYEVAKSAMELTHRWALRSLQARTQPEQALFAIVQGACFEELRRTSADFLTQHDFDGFAIGGLAVGETQSERRDFTELSCSLLPKDKPRYLMGVGTPVDLIEAIHRGVDMFDCILPGAHAQQGTAYTSEGIVRTRRGVYRLDERPLSQTCSCHTCKRYTRAYLHHLTKAKEGLGWRLIALHNYHFYLELMRQVRSMIRESTFAANYDRLTSELGQHDPDYPPKADKPRPPSQPHRLGKFEILVVGEPPEQRGFIRDPALNEQMHRGNDPDAEARLLYVEQTQVARTASSSTTKELVIWDLGMGAAHNAMAALRTIESLETRTDLKVELISFENDLDALRLSTKYAQYFPHLRHAAPHQILSQGAFSSRTHPFDWRLIIGDMLETIAAAPGPDVVMFDPFSSLSHPQFWETDFLIRLRGCASTRGFVLSTYSSATAFRAALLASGYWVFEGVLTGGSRPSTFAFSHFMPTHPAWVESQRLKGEWLQRWRRSSTRFPRSLAVERQSEFAQLVESAAQFESRT